MWAPISRPHHSTDSSHAARLGAGKRDGERSDAGLGELVHVLDQGPASGSVSRNMSTPIGMNTMSTGSVRPTFSQ